MAVHGGAAAAARSPLFVIGIRDEENRAMIEQLPLSVRKKYSRLGKDEGIYANSIRTCFPLSPSRVFFLSQEPESVATCEHRALAAVHLFIRESPEIQSDARALAGMRALDSRPDRAVRTDMHTSLVMHTLVSFPFLCVNQATKQKLQQLAQAMLPC